MIVWVDTETTGLDPVKGNLLEVALVVTSDDLEEVAARSVIVQPIAPLGLDAWREHLDPFIQGMHGKSGLLDAIGRGDGCFLSDAVQSLVGFVRDLCTCGRLRIEHYGHGGQVNCHPQPWSDANPPPAAGSFEAVDLKKVPLAGSTVGFDRWWLKKHMPTLESLFSYRSIDVSSITELAERWAPTIYEGRPKADPEKITHRALPDTRESISILRYYRECGFVGGSK